MYLNVYKLNEITNKSELVVIHRLPITIPEIYDLARHNYGFGKYRVDIIGDSDEVIQSKAFDVPFLNNSPLPRKFAFIGGHDKSSLFRTYPLSVGNDIILEEALAAGFEKDQIKITEYTKQGVLHVDNSAKIAVVL